MDAAIEEDEKIESMIKLMDASESIKTNVTKRTTQTAGSPTKRGLLSLTQRAGLTPRGSSRASSRAGSRHNSALPNSVAVARGISRNSVEIMASVASKLEEEIASMRYSSTQFSGDEANYLEGSSHNVFCRLFIALFRLIFDYRLPIDPEVYLVRGWALFITLATVYFILSVPVRLGFQEEPSLWTIALEVTLEMCFLYDLIVQLRLGFYNNAGELVMDIKAVRKNYLRTWLFSDVVASVPVQTLELFGGDWMQDIIFMKMLRLLKILRMFRLSKKRASLVAQTPSFIRMVQLLAFFIGGLHYMSCIYWATVEHIGFDDDPDHHWVPDTSYTDASFSSKCKWDISIGVLTQLLL
jgi:hypothetical protein